MNPISKYFPGIKLSFGITPHLIACIMLFLGLRIGGLFGFYINADGKGYYAYLPATFIYHDFTFDFTKKTESKYYPPNNRCDFRGVIDGSYINKYFVGTALLWLPFFLAAHFVSLISGLPADGYAPIYQYAILFAAIFYLWLGLLYLRKLLLTFNFNEFKIVIIQILIVFATPVIFFTIHNPDYTHLYSFTLITIFIYYVRKYIEGKQNKYLIGSFIALGLIVLLRPINGMVVFALPFITGNWKRLWDIGIHAFHEWKGLGIGIISFLLILFIQCIFYYLQTDNWFVWSHVDERFYFLHPHFTDALISYKKGLFVYTPITFLALLGFIALLRKSIFEGLSLLVFLILVVYAISSWQCWWYGMAFSLRPMTEFMPFFAILLGFSFQLKMGSLLRIVYGMALAFTICYNTIQLFQYTHYILHWDSMSKDNFWKVFLRTGPEYEGYLWSTPNHIFSQQPGNVLSDTLMIFDFEHSTESYRTNLKAHAGSYSAILDKHNHYGPVFEDTCKNEDKSDTVIFYSSAYISTVEKIGGTPLHWVLKIENESESQYQSLNMELPPQSKKSWIKTSGLFRVERKKLVNSKLKIMLWNSSNKKIFVDDIVVERFR
jgi:hypothetical protein